MTPNEIFVTHETAQLLKRAGFDWQIETLYRDNTFSANSILYDKTISFHFPAPTLEVTQKWLRDVKQMEIVIEPELCDNGETLIYHWHCGDREMYFAGGWTCDGYAPEYEKAQESAEIKCLQILLTR